jgi:hypothetical protein
LGVHDEKPWDSAKILIFETEILDIRYSKYLNSNNLAYRISNIEYLYFIILFHIFKVKDLALNRPDFL